MSFCTDNALVVDRTHASYLGYRNGDQGPRFPVHPLKKQLGTAAWPKWSVRLDPGSVSRVEGGLRVGGRLKSGCAKHPLISYVTVVKNNERTLARTIQSVQNQTYQNVEHIVLDGASTDGTLEIIQRYADVIDYFASEPDAGLYDALNKCIPLARGQLICVLNSDDWLDHDAARIAASHLRDADSAVMILTAARVADDEGGVHEWPPAFVHPGSYFTCANDCHNAIYASRRNYELSGPYDYSYKIAADFKWIMSCLDVGSTFIYTAETTVNYSLGGTSGDFLGHSRECMKIVHDRFPYLSEQEVRGLYHCYFVFNNPQHKIEQDVPRNYTEFLRKIMADHASHVDFCASLGWAAITKMEHPQDRPLSTLIEGLESQKHSFSEKLRRYPRIYNIARKIYRNIRRV